MKLIRGMFLWILAQTVSGESRAVCPTPTVEAVEGDSVSLPCGLEPPDSVVDNAVDWKKLNAMVYSYRNKMENQKDQVAEYRGRTNVSLEGLNTGNMTLWISSVRTSDSGPYRCFTSKLRTRCSVSLTVVPRANETKREDFSRTTPPTHTKPGESRAVCPTPTVEAVEGDSVSLPCGLEPPDSVVDNAVDWKKLNAMVYSYRNKMENQKDQVAEYRGRTNVSLEGLNTGNMTLWISSVRTSDSGPYRCFTSKLRTRCSVSLTVVPRANETKREDFSTTTPPTHTKPGESRAVCPTPTVEAVEGDSVSLPCGLEPPDSVVDNAVDWKKLNAMVYSYRNKMENQKDQVAEYRGRTNVSLEGLNTGNMTLWISSVRTSDSGPYRCFTSKLRTRCSVSLTVVPRANETKREDFSRTTPPTHTKPADENVKLVLCIVLPIVGVFVIIFIFILVKCERIQRFIRRLQGGTEQNTEQAEDDEDPTSAADDSRNNEQEV